MRKAAKDEENPMTVSHARHVIDFMWEYVKEPHILLLLRSRSLSKLFLPYTRDMPAIIRATLSGLDSFH
jgi:hypothetical protein